MTKESPCTKKVAVASVTGELRVEGVEVSVKQFIERVVDMDITDLQFYIGSRF